MVSQIEAKTKVLSGPPPENLKETSNNKVVRLPYLHLQGFRGNSTEWATFWDTFELTNGKNEELEEVQKFRYLTSYLCGSAAHALDGLLSDCHDAIKKLKDRYGDKPAGVKCSSNFCRSLHLS